MKARDNLAAKGADFIIVSALLSGMDQKVHLEAFTVDMAQDMHEPCLDTAAVHSTYDMKDANWAVVIFCHDLILFLLLLSDSE